MDYHFYPKNKYFLNSHANVTFDEVIRMTEEEFKTWILLVRSTIVDIWDNKGIPPLNGYTEQEIIKQFNSLYVHDVQKMVCKDELSKGLCIRNTHNKLGNACNSWFSTMMAVRINYGTNAIPRSIYDYMSDPSLTKNYIPYALRHFKRDSFYAYSRCVAIGSGLPNAQSVIPINASDWIEKFEKFERSENESTKERPIYNYWISEKPAEKDYTGYNEKLLDQEFLSLSFKELEKIKHLIPKYALSNIKKWDSKSKYFIRLFKKGQKIFPIGLKSFRISMCQVAVNYPPTMAKFIWEKYTEKWKDEKEIVVWDPSAGWGGRIIGAMAAKTDRHILYLGTDPNPDHIIKESYTKYDDMAQFFNDKTNRDNGLAKLIDPNTPTINKWKIWSKGSEIIQYEPEFKKYKGKVSVVFTSPPYFHREEYSTDKNQSCHKFSQYEDWKNGFLYETLKTAYEWLRPGGYICWNIASIKEGKTFIPLEEDSREIMEKLGFEFVEEIKMVLGSMPGGNRTTKDSKGELISTNKNTVRMNGAFYRYEPILIYRKPSIEN